MPRFLLFWWLYPIVGWLPPAAMWTLSPYGAGALIALWLLSCYVAWVAIWSRV